MLSDCDIRDVLSKGELTITPFNEKWLRGSGITMHLGETILKPKPGTVIDVKRRIAPAYDKVILEDDKPYLLQPSEFVLGHTFQKVTVGSSLGFMIEGRSTLARIGLTIVQTAMLVYPGHSNRAVTLELANHGPNPILLYPRMKIARVVLFELKTPSTERYDDTGKYRGQESVGEPVFDEEIMKDDELK